MARLSFPREQVQEVFDWQKALGADNFSLAKDQGVYICGDPVAKENPKNEWDTDNKLAYAKGCNPETDDDWYEEARHKVGGDDFGEQLPLQWLELFLTHQHYANKKVMVINVGATQISLGK